MTLKYCLVENLIILTILTISDYQTNCQLIDSNLFIYGKESVNLFKKSQSFPNYGGKFPMLLLLRCLHNVLSRFSLWK